MCPRIGFLLYGKNRTWHLLTEPDTVLNTYAFFTNRPTAGWKHFGKAMQI